MASFCSFVQDVFIGQLQPKAWREEYTGTGSEGSSDESLG